MMHRFAFAAFKILSLAFDSVIIMCFSMSLFEFILLGGH